MSSALDPWLLANHSCLLLFAFVQSRFVALSLSYVLLPRHTTCISDPVYYLMHLYHIECSHCLYLLFE
jgi:hypothetical protein